jgi:hypothetical protein
VATLTNHSTTYFWTLFIPIRSRPLRSTDSEVIVRHTHMVNKTPFYLPGTADVQSQQMAYSNTCFAFLCFVCVYFLLGCSCLSAFHLVYVTFSFVPLYFLSIFIIYLFPDFALFFSIHSVLYTNIRSSFTFNYLVCTHLPLIYFTNKPIFSVTSR